jgi:hypothetical protein
MSNFGRSLAGLGAVAGGYVKGDMLLKDEARQEEERGIRRDDHDAAVAERARQNANRVALADAARPAVVDTGAGGLTKPAYADNSDVGQPGEPGADAGGLVQGTLVNGQSFADPAAATAAANAYNTPDAVRTRQAAALDAQGNPTAAISLQNATISQGAARRKEADDAWRQKVGTAMQNGHEGLAQLASQTEVGPLAGKKVKPVPSEDGKSVTYNLVGDDGTLTPTSLTFTNDQNGVIQAGYMLDRAITPEHRMEGLRKDKELERKTQVADDQHQYQLGQLQNAADRVSLTGQLAEAKIAAAKGTGAPTREERLRYTSLFSDAGRRMAETQKAINTLTGGSEGLMFRNAVKQNPNGPEAQQLQSLQADLKSHQDERQLYQGLLAGSQATGAKGPSLADAKPPTGPVSVSTKAERDKLPKGTRYTGPDGQQYIKQ